MFRQFKGLYPHLLHRNAIGKQVDVRKRDALVGLQGLIHRVGIFRLDADDQGLWRKRLYIGRDARDQASPPHRNEDRVYRVLKLPEYFHADRTLTRDHQWIVVRMHVRELVLRRELFRKQAGLMITVAMKQHLSAAPFDRLYLDGRRRHRHDNRGFATELLRGQRDTLRMIPRRCADHTPFQLGYRQVGHLVIRAAQLEGEHRLQVLALEQNLIAQEFRHRFTARKRTLDGNVVHTSAQDALQIVLFHIYP